MKERPFTFLIGDKVERANGSYRFPGVVIGVFKTSLGKILYAVEHATEPGMVHVFGEKDLKERGEREEIS